METTKENKNQLKLQDEICELLDQQSEQEDIIKEALREIKQINKKIRMKERKLVKVNLLREVLAKVEGGEG